MSRLRRRPSLAAALIFALLALAFVSPALMPGKVMSNSDSLWFYPPWNADIPPELERPANGEVGDAPSVIYPFTRYAKSRLPDVALWNPHLVTGRPFLANMQSAIFSPFSLPSFVMPFYESLAIVAALKLFLAAFGTYLLGRALGMRFGGALLAGIAYGFNLWLVTWLVYPHSSVWALIPLFLWLTERLVRRPDAPRAAAVAAAGGAIILCGHPESSVHAFLAAGLLLVLRAVQARRADGASLRRPAVAFSAAVVGACALAAVALVPFAELLLRSADVVQRAGAGDDQIVQRRFLLGVLLPDYWGRPTGTPLEGFMLSRAFFAGVLPLMLAFAALIMRPKPERLAVAGFGALCLAIVVGVPGIFDAVTAVPPFSSGHNTRLAILFCLSLALLAGWGLDEVTARRPPRSVLAFCVVLLALPVLWVVGAGKASTEVVGEALQVGLAFKTPPSIGEPFFAEEIRLASLFAWLALAGAGVALLVLRRRGRLGATVFVAAAVALCVVDLFRIGVGYNPAIEERFAEQPATGAVRRLAEHKPGRVVSTGKNEQVPQNVLAMRFGLYEARGYDLPVDRRYDRLWRREVSPEYPSQVGPFPGFIPLSLPKVTARRLRTLSLLGVTDVVQPSADPPLTVPGLVPDYDGDDLTIYRNENALPRTWLVGAQTVTSSGEQALDAMTDPGFDARASAVTEREVAGVPRGSAAGPAGETSIEHLGAERVEIAANAQGPSLLVLSDLHYPGWKATLDGNDVPVERVNYVMRGVRLPAGAHRVEFRYEPLSWRIGWIVSLLALVALAVTVLLARRNAATGRARRRRTPAGEPTAPAPPG